MAAFPTATLAEDDRTSAEWREGFIRTYLERDIPQLGARMPAETLRRFWTMLSHEQGALLNAARLAKGLAVSGQTVARYLDLLVDLLLVRRLEPWTVEHWQADGESAARLRARQRYRPQPAWGSKLWRTCSGILWLEAVGRATSSRTCSRWLHLERRAGFYRTSAGAEIDLILSMARKGVWAIEIKRSLAPQPSKGFWLACEDLKPDAKFLVYPGSERFPLKEGLDAISLLEIRELIAAR